MERIAELKKLYEDYNAEATKVKQSANWYDGIFGFGNDPRRNPCHDAFYNAVQAWTENFVAQKPPRDVVLAAARWMVETPSANKEKQAYWYMFAAMGFIDPMLPLLNKADYQEMAQLLADRFPRSERMPLQQNLYKKLVKLGK